MSKNKKSSRLEKNLGKDKKKTTNKKTKKKNKKAKKEKRFSILGFLFSLILIFIIFLCCVYGYYFVKEGFDAKKALNSMLNNKFIKPDKITVLVLGVSTDISTELSDTIMVCSYNPKTQKAFILSIPRDTFVGNNRNSAKGADKINSLYTRGGPKAMAERIENITGLDIDYYAVVKNDALINIVDAIGGVDFEVPIDMDYDDVTQDLHIHLEAGMQKIDGEKAEQLLRFRHNNNGTSYPSSYGDNDFGRMKTQRNFVVQTAKQTLKVGNIFKIPTITSAIFDNLDTDVGMGNAIRYIPSALNFDTESLQTYQLPGDSQKLNSLWFFLHDENKTNQLIEEINQYMDN